MYLYLYIYINEVSIIIVNSKLKYNTNFDLWPIVVSGHSITAFNCAGHLSVMTVLESLTDAVHLRVHKRAISLLLCSDSTQEP